MFIDTKDTTIKAEMDTKHRSSISAITLKNNSLFLLPVLRAPGPDADHEHSPSLTRHNAVPINTRDPPSLCRDHSHIAMPLCHTLLRL